MCTGIVDNTSALAANFLYMQKLYSSERAGFPHTSVAKLYSQEVPPVAVHKTAVHLER